LYTGREWDNDTQLYHFRARWYSPHLGRFVSRDTLGYVDGMSLYAGYFAVRGRDPWGLQERDDKLKLTVTPNDPQLDGRFGYLLKLSMELSTGNRTSDAALHSSQLWQITTESTTDNDCIS
ncbi:MAG TPA: RHS repeat-associated core domain-containing protein, partial [Pirellulaceae bacterium]|nr:RHS repeat-associated core domain-containing protein [Pirellulaceae bacterium]HMP71559.1 RHS repeat-associated core domain-containing protein [Pirellulaceae bacterium]